MKLNRLGAIVPVLAVLAVPGTAAAAATATSSAADGMRYVGTDAADGPRITLAGSTFTIDDTGPITAGAGCASVDGDPTKVTCVAIMQGSQLKQFRADLGDGNDDVRNLTAAPMLANGSLGGDSLYGSATANDELRGGIGVDHLSDSGGLNVLDGGSGDDGLFGGVSSDKLQGGPGRDVLDGGKSEDQLDGGPGADEIDGGTTGVIPGERHDRVLYGDRSAPLNVDLNSVDAQPGAEGDTIVDVEDVVGGRGNDVLIGNVENNALFGGDGDDVLLGEGGLDFLLGGAGADVLFGSPGDGWFGVVPDGFADVMDCSGKGDPIDANDIGIREAADDDLVNRCAQVLNG
jgi:Ca2+-binding RTX toxin-like protein